MLSAVVNDRDTPREHCEGQGVLHPGHDIAAIEGQPRHVVVVHKIAKQIQVVDPVLSRAQHYFQVCSQAAEVQVSARKEGRGATEGRRGDVLDVEIQQPLEHRALGGLWRIGLEEGPIARSDLAEDWNLDRGLEVRQEVLAYIGRRVQAESVDVVRVPHVFAPLDQLVVNEGMRMIQVAKVVEPTFDGLFLVVTRTDQVTHAAIWNVSRAGCLLRRVHVPEIGRLHRAGVTEPGIYWTMVVAATLWPFDTHGARADTLDGRRVALASIGVALGVLVKGHVPDSELVEVLRLVEGGKCRQVRLAMDWAYMIQDDVVHEDHVALVKLPGQLLQFLLGAIVWVDLIPIFSPISVLTIATPSIWVRPIELLDQGGHPNALETHPLDVVELVRDAFDGPIAPTRRIALRGHGLPRRRVCEVVRHYEIQALAVYVAWLVLPLPTLRLAQHQQGAVIPRCTTRPVGVVATRLDSQSARQEPQERQGDKPEGGHLSLHQKTF
mmetsp:Transcript_102716/g.257528  ORF Transcript_102716/g.257528 Transcript_102716/m.257528 type:complete len:494 (+) Transcript_102716:523-2004(+)